MQKRLVVSGLELVGADQESIGVALDSLGDVVARETVERTLAHLHATELVLAREGHDGLVRTLALQQVGFDRMEILDGALDAARHHHGARLAADLAGREHLIVKMIDHDLGLEVDRVVVALHIAPQLLPGLAGVELRIILDLLDQLVVAVDRGVVLEHVEDEFFLDRLLHGVTVEGPVPDLAFGVRR